MNITSDKPSGYRYGAGKVAKSVTFYCAAPNANSVRLVGDFNRWNPASHPMRRRVDGWWFIEVQLTHGHHRYRFLVDTKPVLDPRARVLPATRAQRAGFSLGSELIARLSGII